MAAAFVAGGAGEVRVYDDALLVIGAGRSERVSFSFAGAVRVQDYAVTVEVTGREPVVLTRLGRRTSELAELLATRIREASVRTAAFLAALLPGLDPMAVRAAAGLLRDGVAVPASALDGVHPGLAGTLIQIATRPDRRDAVAELGRAGRLAVGFRQLASVGPARGRDRALARSRRHAAHRRAREHRRRVPAGAGGRDGGRDDGRRAGSVRDGRRPRGVRDGRRAGGVRVRRGVRGVRRVLGVPRARGRDQRARPPADGHPAGRHGGRLTPATEDLSALTVTGESPTVLAFALVQGPDTVAYEALNRPGPATYVFRGELAAVNRALDDAGFDPAALDLAGRVPHDAGWASRIAEFLS